MLPTPNENKEILKKIYENIDDSVVGRDFFFYQNWNFEISNERPELNYACYLFIQ